MFKSISKSELKDVQSASLLNTVIESEEEQDETSSIENKQSVAPNFNQNNNINSSETDNIQMKYSENNQFNPSLQQMPNNSKVQLVLRAHSPMLEDPGSIYMENIQPKINSANILNSRRTLEEALIPEFKDASGLSIISGSNLIKAQKYKDVPFALFYIFTLLIFLIISISIMFSTSENNISKGLFSSTTYYAIKHSIGPVIGTICISSFIGLLWIFFLCNYIKPFMWFTFLSVPLISFVIFLWMLFNGIFGIDNSLIASNQSKLLSIIPLIITGLHCLFIHRYHTLINHCIDIIKVSCVILKQSLDIFGVSLFCLSIQILFSSCWLILFDRLFLLGSSTLIEGKDNWIQDAKLIYLVPFYLFFYWWTTCIIDGIERSVIAGTVSHWYFHQEETQYINGFNATHVSFKRSLTTSFGSICLGGLIASIVRLIQFLRQANDQIPQSVNFITTLLRWLMSPIVWLSDLVEKISFFTISYVGVSGKSFMKSAKSAASLFRRNMARTAIANYTIRFTLYSAIFAYCLLSGYSFFSFSINTLNSPHALTTGIIGTSTSFLVMKFLVNIVLYTTDAVYICYNLDVDQSACHSILAHQVFNNK